MEEMVSVKEMCKGEMLLKFCDDKELWVKSWFKKNDERKITYRSGRNRKIDFMLVENHEKYL